MSAQEAQNAYAAADDRFLAHAKECPICGNTRVKPANRRPCPIGDPMRTHALEKRQEWAAAVAAERAARGKS